MTPVEHFEINRPLICVTMEGGEKREKKIRTVFFSKKTPGLR